jgi:hypothetical protein
MKKTKPVLVQESKTFERQRANLVLKAEGKWVLVKGTKVIETFHCFHDAYAHGCRLFGLKPFMVKEILKVDRVINMTSNWSIHL